jgi:thiamine-phosphate pyrophosphorylase
MNSPSPLLLPAGVYAVCDDGLTPEGDLLAHLRAVLEGGILAVQLRLKRTGERRALDLLAEAVWLCHARGALCLVNDRVDWALASGADGAHLGDEDLPPREARLALGPSRLLGVTARDAQGVRDAQAAGADYVGVGPVFASNTKRLDVPLLGVAGLRRVVQESPLPVVAISGIGLGNIEAVAATGVHGAAVISGLLGCADVTERGRALGAAFEKSARARSLVSG